jgi:hypothetical protein
MVSSISWNVSIIWPKSIIWEHPWSHAHRSTAYMCNQKLKGGISTNFWYIFEGIIQEEEDDGGINPRMCTSIYALKRSKVLLHPLGIYDKVCSQGRGSRNTLTDWNILCSARGTWRMLKHEQRFARKRATPIDAWTVWSSEVELERDRERKRDDAMAKLSGRWHFTLWPTYIDWGSYLCKPNT